MFSKVCGRCDLLFLPCPLQSEVNGLRTLKGVALVELLPAADAAGLDADHLLPAVLGLKVAHAGRLGDVGVPHHDVVEIVADEAQALGAVHLERDGLLGPAGGRVYAVQLAVKRDAARLGLGGLGLELVEVRRAFEAVDGDLGDVLDEFGVSASCDRFYVAGEGRGRDFSLPRRGNMCEGASETQRARRRRW
ncbi:hypothetical protein NLG97_g10841 [Lecanicillium saksenae]|uniref:Uncharacterized protein n=1 Tax=Lecanicillium saksenae TaxID=468837 RepID=A0ACC1QE01_9HYPO|nr:hypothetical protein NLG97_g10841 [Lecanicillium saksenae]